MEVVTLTENIKELKKQIGLVEEERATSSKRNKSTQLANQSVD